MKYILKEFKTKTNFYNDEEYMRANLTFEGKFLGLIKRTKNIIYDVTMFENWKEHKNYWQSMIDNKNLVSSSIVKDRKLF